MKGSGRTTRGSEKPVDGRSKAVKNSEQWKGPRQPRAGGVTCRSVAPTRPTCPSATELVLAYSYSKDIHRGCSCKASVIRPTPPDA